MPAMPPSDFVASATQKGFIFSVKPDGALGVKPPPGGALTEPMRRYVSAMKAELLTLLQSSDASLSGNLRKPEILAEDPRLRQREMVITGRLSKTLENAEATAPELLQLAEVAEKSRHIKKETEAEAPELEIRTSSLHQLGQVGAKSQLSAVLAWACSEAKHGHLPEPAEALPLPSGNVVAPNGAAAWLLAAESRSVGLRSHAAAFPDCALALGIVQRDMEAIAIWARHARLWEDAPYTHDGALCLLPAAEEELRTRANTPENSVRAPKPSPFAGEERLQSTANHGTEATS